MKEKKKDYNPSREFRYKINIERLKPSHKNVMEKEKTLYSKIKNNMGFEGDSLKSAHRGYDDNIDYDYSLNVYDSLIKIVNDCYRLYEDFNLSWYVESLTLNFIHDACAILGSPDYNFEKQVVCPSVNSLYNLMVEDSKSLGVKRISKKKHLAVAKWFVHYFGRIVGNTVCAIKYTRSESFNKEFNVRNKDLSYSILIRTISLLERNGYARSFTGNVLYGCRPMSLLVVNKTFIESLGIQRTRGGCSDPNRCIVKVTDGEGKDIGSNRASELDHYKAVCNKTIPIINKYKEVLEGHQPSFNGYPLGDINLHRVLKENEGVGSRFFDNGSYQGKPKDIRGLLYFKNEHTVSLDFKAIHPAILMYYEGVSLKDHNPYPSIEDIKVDKKAVRQFKEYYNLEKYDPVRNIVKKLFLSLINASSVNGAVGSCYEELNKDNLKKGTYREHTMKYVGLPSINLYEVAQVILEHNKCIKKYLGVGKGNELQYLDSQIIERCLDILSDENIPCIPVHDAITCRVKDKARVTQVMEESFLLLVGEGSLENCIIEEE